MAALAMLGLLMFAGAPARANDVQQAFAQLLQDPGNVELNLRYAELAMARGERRKALAAYERVLASDPGNKQARVALHRLKIDYTPTVTRWRIELGGGYETNAREFPKSVGRKDDAFGRARINVYDQRAFLDNVWRTNADLYGKGYVDLSAIDYGRAGFHTGPVFDIGGNMKLHIAPGGAVSSLDGRYFYGEGSARIGIENILPGFLDSIDVLAGFREVNNDFSSSDGFILDVVGTHKQRDVLTGGDAFYLYPRIRFRTPSGSTPGGIAVPTEYLTGEYVEFGAHAYYFVPLSPGMVFGVNFEAYYRDYDQPVRFGPQGREDGQIAPGVELLFPNLMCRGCDLRTRYRYERNFSNDWTEKYDNHLFEARAVRRF